ncbi:hypothetical protein SHIRM173S_10298 [Streptomyces hirsutus]
MHSDLAEDPIAKARFTREAQSVAGLNHHAIVAVYDSGEDIVGGQAVPYIIMEIVEGRTIRDLLINAEAPGPRTGADHRLRRPGGAGLLAPARHRAP